MRNKALTGVFIALFISACGSNNPVATETTTSTINIGADCNGAVRIVVGNLIDAYMKIDEKIGGVPPSNSEYREWTEAMIGLRQYVRTLDLPLLVSEQNNYVNAIEDYVNAYNTFVESNGTDLSVNEFMIPFNDAESDFMLRFRDAC
jgi:hypothetical protein